MPEKNIRIERVRVRNLYRFASGIIDKAKPGQFIPITLHRALAMSKNPVASPDDVSLLVAYHGKELIGYFGIMAVMMQHGGARHKAQWFSTWMVSPKFLGRGVGSKLMQSALNLKQDYFIVGSKPARRVCEKFGFERLTPYGISVIDFQLAARFNPITLILRGARKLMGLFRVTLDIRKADQFGATLFDSIFGSSLRSIFIGLTLRRARRGLPAFQSKQVNEVHSPDGERLSDKNYASLVRGDEVVNWMLAYPWVVPPGQSVSEELDFYFSDTRQDFEIFAHEVFSKDYRGYVAFQYSVISGKRVLKVLDVEMKTEQDNDFVMPLSLEIAKMKKADQIELSSEYVNTSEEHFLGKLILSKKQRIYQVHPKSEDSPLGRAWRDLQLNYVDGDMPFT